MLEVVRATRSPHWADFFTRVISWKPRKRHWEGTCLLRLPPRWAGEAWDLVPVVPEPQGAPGADPRFSLGPQPVKLHLCPLEPQYSKCGPETSSFGTIWKPVRHTDARRSTLHCWVPGGLSWKEQRCRQGSRGDGFLMQSEQLLC